jgi:hypothetical protein
VHAGDSSANDRTAYWCGPAPLDGGGTQTECGDGHCCHERKRGELEIVCDRDAGFVGQHGDEMRRPDACPGDDACGDHPSGARTSDRGAGAMKKADSRQCCYVADPRRDNDKAPVMFAGEAIQYTKHGHPGPVRADQSSGIHVSLALSIACAAGEFANNV